jgi:hypothetical protein
MPSIIMVGLMVFPYVDSNPLGNGYYTLRQRRFALWMFGAGFLMWIVLIVIGTFIRGPGWIWFWPGQTWDHNAVVFDKNVDLHDMIATSSVGKALHLGFLAQNPGQVYLRTDRGQRLSICRRALLSLVDDGRLQEDQDCRAG